MFLRSLTPNETASFPCKNGPLSKSYSCADAPKIKFLNKKTRGYFPISFQMGDAPALFFLPIKMLNFFIFLDVFF